MQELPQPDPKYRPFWRASKETPLKARCIKDNPPRIHVGEGRELKIGDIVEFTGVCWRAEYYEITVPKEISFYRMEGYFELVEEENASNSL